MRLIELKHPNAPSGERSEYGLPTELDIEVPASVRGFGESIGASILGPEGAPLIVILGGISADRFPAIGPDGKPGWWHAIAGPGRVIDPGAFRILGLDFIADLSGKQAPSTADQAALVCAALDRIGVASAHAVIGASYGAMIALSLGEHFPDRAERLVIVSADAAPHPTSTAIRELQRRVVALGLAGGDGEEGLSIARGMAMLTYRTQEEFAERFEGGIKGPEALGRSEPGDYLRARGAAFTDRMTPQRFISLSASIDRHRVDPARINVPALLIGAQSDQLVPPSQMQALDRALAGPSRLHLLESLFGHDMFLKDAERISALILPFLKSAP